MTPAQDHTPSVSTDLPLQIMAIRTQLPWGEIAQRARHHLEASVPELALSVAELDERVFGLSSGFFYLPAAQAADWGIDEFSWFDQLSHLLAIGHAHFAIQDALVDSGRCSAEHVLLSDVCLLEYLAALDRVKTAPPGGYRPTHEQYYRWYARALMIELGHRKKLHQYTPQEVSLLGLKAAPGNTVLHVVADATDRREATQLLVRSVMQLCTGLQIIDDLNDLAGDLEDCNYTMPLTTTLLRYEGLIDVTAPDVEGLALAGGVSAACMRIAKRYFALAESTARQARADVVVELSAVWHERTVRQLKVAAEAMSES